MATTFLPQHDWASYVVWESISNDIRCIPFLLSVFLIALQILQLMVEIARIRNEISLARLKVMFSLNAYGGRAILNLMVLRVLFSVILVVLEAIVPCSASHQFSTPWGSLSYCPNDLMLGAALFSFIQSIIAFGPRKWRFYAEKYHVLVMVSVTVVYAYRDIWPLATYDLEPTDGLHPWLWCKIVVTVNLALIIPLYMPHRYTPVDPEHPLSNLNSEQTASWISALTYSYFGSVIARANSVRHLRYDELPPLAYYDHAEYLARSAFPSLAPFLNKRRRHLFFGLLNYFRKEYFIMAVMFILMSCLTFTAPVGIKNTLAYLENHGHDSNTLIKPWFWVLLMFIGPLLQSICEHWNLFVQTKVRVHCQALMTQLLLEQSLRMRVKVEAPSDSTSTPRNTSSSGPDLPPTSSTTETRKNHSNSAENLLGKINNLVSSDLDTIVQGTDIFALFLFIPLQIIFSMIFLYRVLGWSSIIGLFIMVVMSPIGGYIGKLVHEKQIIKMKLTDARVQSTCEAVGVLRMIKMFGWEGKILKRLTNKRQEELVWLWKTKVLRLAGVVVSLYIPTLAMLVTYITYTLLVKEELTASKIFSSMAVFTILSTRVYQISNQAGLMIEAKVSLDRVDEFLRDAELLDIFASTEIGTSLDEEEESDDRIGFRNATFVWSNMEGDGSLTSASRNFKLRIARELLFKRGGINLIVGPTGVGKTSMLMALLGEMHYIPSGTESWFNLPRHGGVAYVAQESWVQNATIRENILFGSLYNEERYKNVIRQCALERDLELLEAGDGTEVGERGLTLSGGQKARVTLARAIYSSAAIILLDDVFAALDVYTSAWIVDHCLQGDLIKGRTVILVTHNIALTGPVADFVVSLSNDGSIKTSEGQELKAALKTSPSAMEVAEEEVRGPDINPDKATLEAEGKLVVAEEIVEGHIKWKSMKLLLSALSGEHPATFIFLWISGLVLAEFFLTLQPWFLGVWGSQYEKMAPSDIKLSFYISIFALIVIGTIAITCATYFYFEYRTIHASRVIHDELVASILGSTLRWLDETPSARIIARCTQDIRTIDGPLTQSVIRATDTFVGMSTKLGAIILFTPVFFFPGIVVAILGAFIGNRYLKAQLSIKREMSNARSPILAHVSAALHGLVSIRAYGSQAAYSRATYLLIDHYSRTARASWIANRWIGLRIDAIGAAFRAALAHYLIYGRSLSAANAGFSLNMSVAFCTYIFFLIRLYNELEVQANSLERIQGYIDIEHEPKSTSTGSPPAGWPSSGEIQVENLSARYSKSGPEVLHNLTFNIASGERVGVVGRTGSGKSSLTLALLRCILTEGTVYYDGVATNTINLDALRSNITIIPQVPELLSGTLRQNLDPFDQNDDATLNNALRAAGLFSLQEGTESGDVRLTLDSNIAGAGANLSIGQRQIIALARAMVRGSKLLILDEATSAIDYKTDAVIQSTLRSQLGSDVTVITVAHRLQTIMDADKIMVLDSGRIVEFDTPNTLLQKERGVFRAMVQGGGNK